MPKVGRPQHQPTEAERRQVETMASYGITLDDIARVLKITAPTLRKHYAHELETGHIKANSMVAQSLFRKATGDGPGAVVAAIFWLKVRAGWSEFSPAPLAPVPGKKERMQLEAETAADGSDWARLVH